MTDTHTGLHQIGFGAYTEDPRMNASTLIQGFKSMRSLKLAIDGKKPEETAAKRFGQQYHTVILEPERFSETHVVMPTFKLDPENVDSKGNRSTNANTNWVKDQKAKFYADNSSKAIIDQADYDKALAMLESLGSSKAAKHIIETHDAEMTVYGQILGVQCKGRVDLLGSTITDLKGTNDVRPKLFGNTAARLRYPEKLAFYRELVRQNTGENLPVLIIAVETSGDFDRVVYRLGDAELDEGFNRICKLIERYKQAKETDEWPGVDEGRNFMPFFTPNWAMEDEDDGLDWEDV